MIKAGISNNDEGLLTPFSKGSSAKILKLKGEHFDDTQCSKTNGKKSKERMKKVAEERTQTQSCQEQESENDEREVTDLEYSEDLKRRHACLKDLRTTKQLAKFSDE